MTERFKRYSYNNLKLKVVCYIKQHPENPITTDKPEKSTLHRLGGFFII